MLEAFRILEEDKGIKKEDIIEAVTESCAPLIVAVMVKQIAQPLNLTKKQVIFVSIQFVKWWTKFLIAVWKSA